MRQKKRFTLPAPKELREIGFPEYFEGKRSVIRSISEFVENHLEELIELYHPTAIDYDEFDREVERLSWREICEKEAKGYRYVPKPDGTIGQFYSDQYLLESIEDGVEKYERAVAGELTTEDYLGYIPSWKRNDIGMLQTAVINKESDAAIRRGYYFRIIGRVKGSSSFEDAVDYGIAKDILHKVSDSIINLTPYEEGELEDIFEGKAEDEEDLLKEYGEGLLTEAEYYLKRREIAKNYYNALFLRRRSQQDSALYVDSKRSEEGGTIDVTLKNKRHKLLRSLTEVGYKRRTTYQIKEDAVRHHFVCHPDSSISEAARELGMSRDTVRKYKDKLTKVGTLGVYNNTLLDTNGANFSHPPKLEPKPPILGDKFGFGEEDLYWLPDDGYYDIYGEKEIVQERAPEAP